METAKIFDFKNGEELNIKILDGGKKVKLTKEGKVKATKNNQKESRRVDPIKDTKDIERCKEFLRNRIKNAPERYKKSYAKDLLLFCIGINCGTRVGDLLELKWEDIFKQGTKRFNDFYVPKEQKTGKTRRIYINDAFKSAVKEYLKYVPETVLEGYVFTNRQNEKLSDTSVDKMLKMLQNSLELPYRLSTHSLRKTFAYHVYINSGKDIGLVQRLLNHSTSFVTLRYIGVEDEVQEKAYNDLNL